MGMFDDAKTVVINNKEVKSIKLTSNNAVLYEKPIDNYEISLTSDKYILSYHDNESATLTATVTAEDQPVSGVTVNFDLGYTTTTSQTNNNGIATATYSSHGYGDVDVIASYNNSEASILIEDCTYYDSCSTNKTSNYTSFASEGSASGSLSFSTDHYTLSTGSNYPIMVCNNVAIPPYCKIECDVYRVSGGAGLGITDGTNVDLIAVWGQGHDRQRYINKSWVSGAYKTFSTPRSITNRWVHLTILFEAGMTTYIIDDYDNEEITSLYISSQFLSNYSSSSSSNSISAGSSPLYFGLTGKNTSNSNTFFKNIKVKTYNSPSKVNAFIDNQLSNKISNYIYKTKRSALTAVYNRKNYIQLTAAETTGFDAISPNIELSLDENWVIEGDFQTLSSQIYIGFLFENINDSTEYFSALIYSDRFASYDYKGNSWILQDSSFAGGVANTWYRIRIESNNGQLIYTIKDTSDNIIWTNTVTPPSRYFNKTLQPMITTYGTSSYKTTIQFRKLSIVKDGYELPIEMEEGLSLDVDKEYISYTPYPEYATLSATLVQNQRPVPDQQITFDIGGNTTTATTNTNGVATTNYYASRKGYVRVQAYTTDNLKSNEIIIKDAHLYKNIVTAITSANLSLPSKANISFKMMHISNAVDIILQDNSHNYYVGNWASSAATNGFLIRNIGSTSNLVDYRGPNLSASVEYTIGTRYNGPVWEYSVNNNQTNFTANYTPTKIDQIDVSGTSYMHDLLVMPLNWYDNGQQNQSQKYSTTYINTNTFSWDSDEQAYKIISNSDNGTVLFNHSFPSNIEINVDVKIQNTATQYNAQPRLIVVDGTSNQGYGAVIHKEQYSSSDYSHFKLYSFTLGSTPNDTLKGDVTQSFSPNTWYRIKMIIKDNIVTTYLYDENGNSLQTLSTANTLLNEDNRIGILGMHSSNNIFFKNLSIYDCDDISE